jgi:hypothetical protein
MRSSWVNQNPTSSAACRKAGAATSMWTALVEGKRNRASRRAADLAYTEAVELGEMARDMFDDRQGFGERRQAFVTKRWPVRSC